MSTNIKIVTPLNHIDEIEPLIEAGAGEFYLGYLDNNWTAKYGALTGNRREFYHSNITNYQELTNIVRKAHEFHIPVAVTLNERYTNAQYADLHNVLMLLLDIDVDAFIVADIGLLIKINEWGMDIPIHISTGGGVLNSESADFYRRYGAERIILPRQFNIEEMNQIAKQNTTLDFEIFGIFGRDPYLDAFCNFHHGINGIIKGLGPCGCMTINEVEQQLVTNHKKTGHVFIPFKALNHLKVDGCCACSLSLILGKNINAVKLVGRGAKTQKKICGVKMLKYAIDLSEQHYAHTEYCTACKNKFRELFEEDCSAPNCYF